MKISFDGAHGARGVSQLMIISVSLSAEYYPLGEGIIRWVWVYALVARPVARVVARGRTVLRDYKGEKHRGDARR